MRSFTPCSPRSTEPSTDREEREGRGHGTIAFTEESSRAYVYPEIVNIDPDDIVMAHLHCGRPGQLGPIIVDSGATGDVAEYVADNVLSYEVTNADIAAATNGHGIVGALTAGCPIVPTIPNDRHRTVAGMAMVAERGELYVNVHTKQQTFDGDIRGQLQAVPQEEINRVLAS
ncbi:MAG: CHRD domain-containing protein [Actinomycetota bacterium]